MGNSLDSAPALIFIPDINGFTAYISKTDIRVAKKVIPALLETIIEQNELDLKLVEIQGDAILYYKIGEPPSPTAMVSQAKKIFSAFTEKLEELSLSLPQETLSLPERLGIKIVTHYGKIAITKIRGNVRLIGEDVIIAHRLLKNSIEADEYLLMTEAYTSYFEEEELEQVFAFGELMKGQDTYEHIGPVNYRYASLKPLFSRSVR
ncbi:DUF2652 domain-containing protein [Cesiribacter andamanensis]|uniref:Guanylate cyclase domain-containing protein n=1 Tax=Cesiribacter andamanensis AMV16 TaxID=1279009 RepID=M7NQG3_9BACT|nr:DUF2652 domain-containing protein [Cesiribacter andamanensis]EMR03965.1 hypothetical protein ADICEAN_00836 [Cesiribacter andamanensis AMV16]